MFAKYGRLFFLIEIMRASNLGVSNAISNTQFNASIREYAVAEDSNSTDVRTLQKELYERYAHLAPASNTIRFKEGPDNLLSPSSAHGRGLLHLNHHGYGLGDYEEGPHSAYEYHLPDDHHGHYETHSAHDDYHGHSDGHHGHFDGPHGHFDGHHGHFDEHHGHYDHGHEHHGHIEHYGHHVAHHDDHKHGYGHHFKHYDHALAAKTVLWPIAGIALLGAAAALVSNPVLLQLGVVSGRRRRRDTEEISDKDEIITKKGLEDELILHNLNHFNINNDTALNKKVNYKRMGSIRGMLLNKAMNSNHRLLFRNVNPTVKTAIQSVSHKPENNRDIVDKHYIPIPLMIKDIDGN